MDPTSKTETVQSAETLLAKRERLASEFYDKLAGVLNKLQAENNDPAGKQGFPGQLESDFIECWNNFVSKNSLTPLKYGPSIGLGNEGPGNSWGIILDDGIETAIIYRTFFSSDRPQQPRYVDRLDKTAIKKLMDKIVTS